MNNLIYQPVDFHVFTESLMRTIEARDIYTAGHSNRVAELVFVFARIYGFPEKDILFRHLTTLVNSIFTGLMVLY